MSKPPLHHEQYELILRRATAGLMDHRDRKRLIELTIARAKQRTLAMQIVLVVLGVAIVVLLGNALPNNGLSDIIMTSSLFAFVLGGGFLLARRRSTLVCRIMSKKLLLKGLRPNICLVCLYDLRGSKSSACPECGEPIAPARQYEEKAGAVDDNFTRSGHEA